MSLPTSLRESVDIVLQPSSSSTTTRAEVTTETLTKAVEEWEPTLPVEVVRYLLGVGGCETKDRAVLKLVALEVQRFAGQVLSEARQNQAAKNDLLAQGGGQPGAKRLKVEESASALAMAMGLLEAPDLIAALKTQGVKGIKAPYWMASSS